MATQTNAKLFDEWKEKHFSFCRMHIFRHIEIFVIVDARNDLARISFLIFIIVEANVVVVVEINYVRKKCQIGGGIYWQGMGFD